MERVTKLMLSFLFVLCLFGMDIVQAAHSFRYCSETENYAVKVEDVTLSPDPVDSTKPWTITATASYDSKDNEFSCANKKLNVIIGADGSGDQKYDLCEKVSNVTPSSFVISHTQSPTSSDPIYVYLWLSNEDDEFDVVTCIYVNLENSPPSMKKMGRIFLPSDA